MGKKGRGKGEYGTSPETRVPYEFPSDFVVPLPQEKTIFHVMMGYGWPHL